MSQGLQVPSNKTRGQVKSRTSQLADSEFFKIMESWLFVHNA